MKQKTAAAAKAVNAGGLRKRSFLEKTAAVPHIVWTVLFIVAPLLIVAYYAISGIGRSDISLLDYGPTFLMSICFALIATVVCLLIGYPLAYFMSRTGERAQKFLLILVMMPMWINLLIRTYSLMALLDRGGLVSSLIQRLGGSGLKFVGTPGAVILGMVYDFLPYMVLPIFTAMTKLDNRYIEAAQDLGCNPFKVMTRVVVPLTVPGVVSGVTMVFVPSISTFYISQKMGVGSFDLIGDAIERQFANPTTYRVGSAVSLVMMLLILASIAIMNRFTDDDEEGGIIV